MVKKASENFIKKIVAIILVAVLFASVFGSSIHSEAGFDSKTALNYQGFSGKTEVPDAVLFIGTFIMHKDGLTDDLYTKAVKMGARAGQSTIYYKSELSDGQWFEVGNIDNGIKGISSEGRPVTVDTIKPLYVQYYMGKDGILRDAKTMEPVNPFDIPDPYDLTDFSELEPILNNFTSSTSATSITQADYLKNKNSKESGNLRSDVYTYQLLSTFFSLNLRDSQTDKYDEQLKNLNSAYINYKIAGQDDEAALVYELMGKVDGLRRAIVMEKLSQLDGNILNSLYSLCSGSQYTSSGSFKDTSSAGVTASSDENVKKLQDSVSHDFLTENESAIQNILTSWFGSLGIKSYGNGWWTVLDDAASEKRSKSEEANKDNEDYVYDKTPNESPFSADKDLLDAIGTALSNCSNSYTEYKSKALVDTEDILGHVIYKYSVQVIDQSSGGALGGPVSYLKYATNIKDGIIGDKEGELSFLKSSLISVGASKYAAAATAGPNSEYSSLTSEGAKKSALEKQKTDLEAIRSTFQYLIEAMRQRDEGASALEYVNDRIDITEDLLKQIPSDDFKSYSTSSVQGHLSWLREEIDKIIASDESLKSKLDELRDRKAELQRKRDQCLDNNDLAGAKAYDAKIAAVDKDIEANGSDAASMADKLVDKAMSKLADNSDADLAGIAQALADVGDEDALNALAEKAKDSGASANAMAGINDAQNSLKDKSSFADAEALLADIESMLGKSVDEMDDRELIIADCVASKIAKSGDASAETLVQILTNRLLTDGNKYLYRQYEQNKSNEYISMEAISDISAYRYLYDDNKTTATMTSGSKVYTFKLGSDEMTKNTAGSESEELSTNTVYQNYVYLSEDDALSYFGCSSEYLSSVDYAACLTKTMQSDVEEYVNQLQENSD